MTLKRSSKPLKRSPLAKVSKRKASTMFLMDSSIKDKDNIPKIPKWALRRGAKPLKRTPLAKISSKKTAHNALEKPLNNKNGLRKSTLRRISPKQQQRLKKQSIETKKLAEKAELCPETGQRFSEFNPANQHHIIPRGVGGSDSQSNKELISQKAHEKKRKWMSRLAEMRDLKVEYTDQYEIEKLLGEAGKSVLDKIIAEIKKAKTANDWPLLKVEIGRIEDLERKGWKYVLILLHFECNYTTADAFLKQLYIYLDLLELNVDEAAIFQSKIHFDVESKQ